MASSSIIVNTPTDTFKLVGRPCEISAYSLVPTRRKVCLERTVFNTPEFLKQDDHQTARQGIYDRIFYTDKGFNQILHRDDREHAKSLGLNVHEEERHKIVPSLSSTEYGHKLNPGLETRDSKHVRVGYVQSEFYRRNMF